MFCRKCGQSLPDCSKFCPACGAAVMTDAAAPDPKVLPPTPPQTVGPIPQQPVFQSASFQQQPVRNGNPGYAPIPPAGSPRNLSLKQVPTRWPVIVPILLLIGLLLFVSSIVLIAVLDSYIFKTLYLHNIPYLLSNSATLVFGLICVILFFVTSRRHSLPVGIFHGLMLLIPVVISIVADLCSGYFSFSLRACIRYGCILTMAVVYLIGTILGRKSTAVSVIYTIAAALCLCEIIVNFIVNVRFFTDSPIWYFIASVLGYVFIYPIYAGFIVSVFCLPKKQTSSHSHP